MEYVIGQAAKLRTKGFSWRDTVQGWLRTAAIVASIVFIAALTVML